MEKLVEVYNLYKNFDYHYYDGFSTSFLALIMIPFITILLFIIICSLFKNIPEKYTGHTFAFIFIIVSIIGTFISIEITEHKEEENKRFNQSQLIKVSESLTNEQKLLLNNEVYLYLIEKKRTKEEDVILLPKEVLLKRTDKIYFSSEEVNEFFRHKRKDFLSFNEQQIKNEVEGIRKELEGGVQGKDNKERNQDCVTFCSLIKP